MTSFHHCLALSTAIAALWCASPAMSASDQIVGPTVNASVSDLPFVQSDAGSPMHANGACGPVWSSEFGAEPNNEVWALLNFDDGTGPALYVGGQFTTIGSMQANGIARWDGTSWSALGDGMDGLVTALTVFDDGTGSALYAGGRFANAGGAEANRIAKWDGAEWSPLGDGLVDENIFAAVYALTVFDDGTGPALYAGGDFTTAGGAEVNGVAKWDGASWSALEGWTIGTVWELTVFDDGTGPALYVGGTFDIAEGAVANLIAKWDGISWSSLGDGLSGGSALYALREFDDGTGPALYAGGNFSTADGAEVNRIAKWDGVSWMPVGAGFASSYVFALTVFDDGTGPALFAGGGFINSGGTETSRIAKWDGESWSPLGTGLNDMNACSFAVFDDGTGPNLIVGGRFTSAGAANVKNLARWDGRSWAPLGLKWTNGTIRALTRFDDGTGPAIFAGGEFTNAGGVSANRVAKWNGESWSPLSSGAAGFGAGASVRALAVHDDGTGPALYAGGTFISAGGAPASRIAKWDGSVWLPLGGGVNGTVLALAAFDDGTGSAIYAGGEFTSAGGAPANRIAKWDGSVWSALGGGMDFSVRALTVFDDGTGPALYAAGTFIAAGDITANRIAKWDGSVWSSVGGGITGGPATEVNALTVFDDGTGSALYAAGTFGSAGGVPMNRIARWDGNVWSSPQSGVNGTVYAMTVFDDGSGPALFVGGAIPYSWPVFGGVSKWDGSSWSTLGDGISGSGGAAVLALASLEGEAGGLYVGGNFTVAAGAIATHITKWQGCAVSEVPCPADVNGDGAVDLADLVAVLSAWGACAGCAEDLNDDGVVDVLDLFVVLEAWGVCP